MNADPMSRLCEPEPRQEPTDRVGKPRFLPPSKDRYATAIASGVAGYDEVRKRAQAALSQRPPLRRPEDPNV